jgi:CHAD domain-containing protein
MRQLAERRDKEDEEVLRQLAERCDKEDEEVRQQLAERREKAKEKYQSYFTVDRYQNIIRRGEIDMESLLPSPQAPIVSISNLSFKAFVEQRGQLKQ